MGSSSPSVLPISSSSATAVASAASSDAPPSALRVFITNITETVYNGLSNRRPWAELLDRSAISKPESISEATQRIRKNYTYFRINYLTVITAILAFSLLTNPFSLLLLAALLAAWLFLYLFRSSSDPPLSVFGRQLSDTETLGALIVSTIVVIFLTSVGSLLLSAFMVGAAVVCAHAAFRAPDDLFIDQQDSPATGFLSFLSGAATNSAVANSSVAAA